MQVFAFQKIIAICRILMSEAWYTMDILANRILGHGSVTISTKRPKCPVFCSLITFKRRSDNCKRPLEITRITPN